MDQLAGHADGRASASRVSPLAARGVLVPGRPNPGPNWQGVRLGDQIAIPAAIMRGGTSRGAFFAAEDLPGDVVLRDRIILAVYGSSPDGSQIDGIGGGHPLTSKVAIVSRSARADADVDYLFGQVRLDEPVVDYTGNCGNMLAGVGPFAIDEGLIPNVEPITRVRIHVVNTGHVITAEIPVRDGFARSSGTGSIAGVQGTGASIHLDFAAAGSMLGRGLLPTGRPLETMQLEDGRLVPVSIVDAGNPSVFTAACEVGLDAAAMLAAELDAGALATLLEVRALAAERLGLVTRAADAASVSPTMPKIYTVHEPHPFVDRYGATYEASDVSLLGRGLVMGRPHRAYAVTAAVCTATAARIPGTVVASMCAATDGPTVRIGHPSGVTEVKIEVDVSPLSAPRLVEARLVRTARRIASGVVYVPAALVEDGQ